MFSVVEVVHICSKIVIIGAIEITPNLTLTRLDKESKKVDKNIMKFQSWFIVAGIVVSTVPVDVPQLLASVPISETKIVNQYLAYGGSSGLANKIERYEQNISCNASENSRLVSLSDMD